jgi:glutamine synthetase
MTRSTRRVTGERGSSAVHIEYRIGDVAAVSYQYASSQLASGLDGLMRKVVTAW